jgi:hypothetical protein
MRIEPLRWIGLGLLAWLLVAPALADETWRTRGELSVATAGIVETILPPELVSRADDGTLDLTLAGPDGLARSFELFWREPVADRRRVLTARQVTLDTHERLVWEGPVPDGLVVREVSVQLGTADAIGRLDVEGLRQGQWELLVQNAAVFKAGGAPRATIALPQGAYQSLRLRLSGLDRRARTSLAPIQEVTVVGAPTGRDYALQPIDLAFQRAETDGHIVIEAVLPGSGLHLRNVQMETEASFQGAWQLGRETIAAGRKAFVVTQSGRVEYVGRQPQRLTVALDRPWPGSSLVVRLNAGERFIGAITALRAEARLPRLVFAAERPGRYTLSTGGGQRVPLLEQPGDALRRADLQATVTAILTNPLWRPASLVERFQLKGAPFDARGYTWRAPLEIPEAGYYRLALSLEATLKAAGRPLRIVQEGAQVPYIQGRLESQGIDLPVAVHFDTQKNRSQWTIQLPGAGGAWQALSLHAEGLFSRRVQWERPKPGNLGWEPWRTVAWENRDVRETALRLDLADLPPDVDRLRATIDNGDNAPITISKITARYNAPTVYFLAHGPGPYQLYGGNPQAAPPQYDLSLVQSELLAVLAQETRMGALEFFRQPGWQTHLAAAFKESGWGLYAVLGLVTLVLIVVIVRMFPKGAPAKMEDNNVKE